MHGGDIYRNQVELDFSVNINPCGPPHKVKKALMQGMKQVEKYPDIQCQKLREALADKWGVSKEKIICANGASELLLAISHAINPKKALLAAPGFGGYEYALKAVEAEIKYWYAKKENNFSYSQELAFQIKQDKPDIVMLSNPSNPVGTLMTSKVLQQVLLACKEMDAVLVIDECFMEFVEKEEQYTLISSLQEYQKIIVIRAFTKSFALPGVRLGYMLCESDNLCEKIRKHLPEWNVSVFAQEAGICAIEEWEYLEKSVKYMHRQKAYLEKQLRNIGVTVYPSAVNYLLVEVKDKNLWEVLLKEKILIRDCSDYKGLERGFYRIAVRNQKENKQLLQKLENVLKEK